MLVMPVAASTAVAAVVNARRQHTLVTGLLPALHEALHEGAQGRGLRLAVDNDQQDRFSALGLRRGPQVTCRGRSTPSSRPEQQAKHMPGPEEA